MKTIQPILISMLAAVLALLVGAALISAAGISPVAAYGKLFQGALGLDPNWSFGQPLGALISRPVRLGNSLTEATPLILAGLALALPFHCGLLNIGAEGQIYAGGLGATVIGLYSPEFVLQVPGLHLALALIAAFACGALWGAIPGILRAYRGLNEIITSIMLNFVAFWSVSYLVHGPMKDPKSFGYDWSREIPSSAQLPIIVDTLRLNVGFAIGLVAVVATALLLRQTTLGFEIRAIGSSPAAARFAGIRVERGIVMAMAMAGGFAGLAGAGAILGVQFRLSDFFSPGYGYDSIAVAFVGQAQPVSVLLFGLFFGVLRTGAETMELAVGVPKSIVTLIQALTLIFVIISQSPTIARWIGRQRTARRARIAGTAASTLPLR